jgi:NADH-quinone oxidoreductase subunit E
LLAALFAAQEQNHGFLTDELMDAVARYLELPPHRGVRGGELLFDVRDRPGRPQQRGDLHQHQCWLNGAEDIVAPCREEARHPLGESTPTAASSSSARKSAWRPAVARR